MFYLVCYAWENKTKYFAKGSLGSPEDPCPRARRARSKVWAFPRQTCMARRPHKPNLPKTIPTKICWHKLSGKSSIGLGIPTQKTKIMLESNPLKSRILVLEGKTRAFDSPWEGVGELPPFWAVICVIHVCYSHLTVIQARHVTADHPTSSRGWLASSFPSCDIHTHTLPKQALQTSCRTHVPKQHASCSQPTVTTTTVTTTFSESGTCHMANFTLRFAHGVKIICLQLQRLQSAGYMNALLNCLGHGHGYGSHSSLLFSDSRRNSEFFSAPD